MKNKMMDERVILSRRKIQSDGFTITWFILLISVLIQQYLKAPTSQYIVELVIFLSMSVYLLIFNFVKGNDMYPENSKKGNSIILTQSIFTGLIITIINTTQNYFNYGNIVKDTIAFHIVSVAAVSFITSTTMAFLTLKTLAYLNDKKQQKIIDDLDMDE